LESIVVTGEKTASAIPVDVLQSFCERVLVKAGASAVDARTTADGLVTTDSWGIFTHGTKLLAGYLRRIRGGGSRVDRSPQIALEGPAWAVVDGQSTLGQVTSSFAVQCAIQKARDCGIGYVGVRNSCHFGAAGYYAWLAARENMIGIAMANDTPSVAAPGSRGPVIGSNPIAYAIPAGSNDPLLLDISVAAAAGGKVFAHWTRGEPIPEGWLVGRDGRPTTDGSLFPEQASLAPMAGHKGYGIGLLIEVLSGVLTGAGVTRQIPSWLLGDQTVPTDHGAAFLAIDVGAIMPPSVFETRMDGLVKEIHSTHAAEGAPGVLLPGQREWESRRRALRDGIRLPSDVLSVLGELASQEGISLSTN
jgi:ureidoglycolate dehydrogenase (NAD+)